jgi:hypothetical protein
MSKNIRVLNYSGSLTVKQLIRLQSPSQQSEVTTSEFALAPKNNKMAEALQPKRISEKSSEVRKAQKLQ